MKTSFWGVDYILVKDESAWRSMFLGWFLRLKGALYFSVRLYELGSQYCLKLEGFWFPISFCLKFSIYSSLFLSES